MNIQPIKKPYIVDNELLKTLKEYIIDNINILEGDDVFILIDLYHRLINTDIEKR